MLHHGHRLSYAAASHPLTSTSCSLCHASTAAAATALHPHLIVALAAEAEPVWPDLLGCHQQAYHRHYYICSRHTAGHRPTRPASHCTCQPAIMCYLFLPFLWRLFITECLSHSSLCLVTSDMLSNLHCFSNYSFRLASHCLANGTWAPAWTNIKVLAYMLHITPVNRNIAFTSKE